MAAVVLRDDLHAQDVRRGNGERDELAVHEEQQRKFHHDILRAASTRRSSSRTARHLNHTATRFTSLQNGQYHMASLLLHARDARDELPQPTVDFDLLKVSVRRFLPRRRLETQRQARLLVVSHILSFQRAKPKGGHPFRSP